MMLIGHDVCDFPLLSKCLCSNENECSKGAFIYFVLFFFCWQESTQIMKYHCMFWKKKVWKLIVGKNEWLIMLTVSFYFMHSRQRFFLYTCSNNPHEVSIEFLWLYVINVYIFVKHVCYFCLLTSCFSLLRVCECHIMYAYFAVSLKSQHLHVIVFFYIYNTAYTYYM